MLDASALLAVLLGEPGAAEVADAIAEEASVSAANWAETATVLVRQRRDPEPAMRRLHRQVEVVPLSPSLALAVAAIYARTRRRGCHSGTARAWRWPRTWAHLP